MRVYPWWIVRINEAIPKGVTREQIAERIEASTGWKADATSITRCLNGKQPTIELVLPLSDLFGVPRPIFFPRDELEAHRMAMVAAEFDAPMNKRKQRLGGLDAEVAVLKAGVPTPDFDHQTKPLDPVHASSVRPRRPGRRQRAVGTPRT